MVSIVGAAQATPKPKAKTFFSGRALAAAGAIDDGDLSALKRILPDLDVNAVHHDDMTLLAYAIAVDQPTTLGTLVEAGANPIQEIPDLGSPLRLAVLAKSTKFLVALLDAGVSPDSRDENSDPILFAAAAKNEDDALVLLLDRGADPDARDRLGNTAAYEALTRYKLDNVVLLLERGSSATSSSRNGVTLAFAIQRRLARDREPKTVRRLEQIKTLLMSRGAVFPADPPARVREQRKAQGLDVIER